MSSRSSVKSLINKVIFHKTNHLYQDGGVVINESAIDITFVISSGVWAKCVFDKLFVIICLVVICNIDTKAWSCLAMLINQTTPTGVYSLPTGVHSGRNQCMYEYLCIRNLDDITSLLSFL